MWVNRVGQGCSDPSTGYVQRHTQAEATVRDVAVALWLKRAADIRVIAITVGVVRSIHHPQSSLLCCLQSLSSVTHSSSTLFISFMSDTGRYSPFMTDLTPCSV